LVQQKTARKTEIEVYFSEVLEEVYGTPAGITQGGQGRMTAK